MSETDLEPWYRILAIAPGASLADLEVAYRQQMYRLSREGSRQQLAQMKTAYLHLKAYLEAQAPESPLTPPEPEAEVPPVSTHREPPPQASKQTNALAVQRRQRPTEPGAFEEPEAELDPLAALLQDKLNAKHLKLEVKLKGAQVLVLLEADQVPDPVQLLPAIQTALWELKLPQVQTAKVYGLRRHGGAASVVWSQELLLIAPPEPERFDRFSFQSLTTNALALPVATLVALILNASFFRLFLSPFQIWIHEFGHATIAWLGGRRATPLPFGWTNYSFERSLFVYFGILILLALLFRQGWLENLRWPRYLAIGIALLQFVMTWLVPHQAIEMLITFGGIGGEFYLSTFLMVCFYCRFPDRWRWDFWRYLVAVIAASTFWRKFWLWHRIQRGQASIPWGTLLFGQGDAGGDMNRLVDDFGWTPDQIIQTYSQLGNLCLLVLIGVYLLLLFRQSPRLWAKVKQTLDLGRAGR